MPFYNYVCETCNYFEEVFHNVKLCGDNENNPYLKCKSTEKKQECCLRRQISGTNLVFFDSKTPGEKKEVLKKRSHQHFKKHLEESFHEKNKPGFVP